ncbi:arsenate reductase ArsC [Nibricoccus sp. IMCC34717]|uniref:arsenate reductase/protein-tyrosine-phosphatase family protein n=1 Tax=Nibricoccus sp. IMCC34717 TaxID=3034021 RepID=UPI00384A740C
MNPTPSFSVLMLSERNSIRSILAEHILRAKARGRFDVRSAGLHPSGSVDPLTLATLDSRYGIDAKGSRSKSWEEYRLIEFDFVISLSASARDNRILWRGNPVHAHWGSPSPIELACTPDGLEQAFIDVASQIAARATLFCSFPDEKLVRAAWDVGTRFPFRPDYSAPDCDYEEYVAPAVASAVRTR